MYAAVSFGNSIRVTHECSLVAWMVVSSMSPNARRISRQFQHYDSLRDVWGSYETKTLDWNLRHPLFLQMSPDSDLTKTKGCLKAMGVSMSHLLIGHMSLLSVRSDQFDHNSLPSLMKPCPPTPEVHLVPIMPVPVGSCAVMISCRFQHEPQNWLNKLLPVLLRRSHSFLFSRALSVLRSVCTQRILRNVLRRGVCRCSASRSSVGGIPPVFRLHPDTLEDMMTSVTTTIFPMEKMRIVELRAENLLTTQCRVSHLNGSIWQRAGFPDVHIEYCWSASDGALQTG